MEPKVQIIMMNCLTSLLDNVESLNLTNTRAGIINACNWPPVACFLYGMAIFISLRSINATERYRPVQVASPKHTRGPSLAIKTNRRKCA